MLERAMIEDFCIGLEREGCVRACVVLQHFYTLFRERDEQSAIIGRLRDALQYARATLADHHDIEDGGECDEVRQRPNWAMRATNAIDEALYETSRANPQGEEK